MSSVLLAWTGFAERGRVASMCARWHSYSGGYAMLY